MSTPEARTFEWRGDRLEPTGVDAPEAGVLLAAESWLTVDGAVRALDLHRQRFADAVRAQLGDSAPERRQLDDFWHAVTTSLPTEGRVFPRVELTAGVSTGSTTTVTGPTTTGAPSFRVRMRPAPAAQRSLVLAAHHGDDPRTRPEIKGPDLDTMVALRAGVQAAGADEAVLLVDGRVVEGTTTALLWWNGDTLVTVPNWMPRVASITERSIRALATAFGTDVVEYLAAPEELDHKEIWAVNALHGIRLVTEWIDGPRPAAKPGRHDRWRRSIDALRQPAA